MATLRTFQWWALAVALGVGCSVNHAGLSTDGGPQPASGSGGSAIVSDGGTGSGGNTATGSGGNSGTGGQILATGGRTGTGGAADSGGAPGTGGGSGGYFAMGGTVGSGGAPGSGGDGSGGAPGTGGAGSGGAPGTGGAGSGGRAGTGGRLGNCSRFPDAMAFMPPGEDRTHCYWFRAETRTWPAARNQCQNETGGDLVTITSQAENDFVRGVARFTANPPESWIGATDDRPGANTMGPGTYHWVTNDAWGTYTNWNQTAPKQPDGFCDPCSNNQTCTCDHRGTLASDGTWFDFWQDNARAYVCEALAP